jgi:hypothetical protein
MTLRGLRAEDEADAKRAQELLAREDFPFPFDFDPAGDFAAYLRRVENGTTEFRRDPAQAPSPSRRSTAR